MVSKCPNLKSDWISFESCTRHSSSRSSHHNIDNRYHKQTEFNLEKDEMSKKSLISQRIMSANNIDSSIEALHIYNDGSKNSPDIAPYWERFFGVGTG